MNLKKFFQAAAVICGGLTILLTVLSAAPASARAQTSAAASPADQTVEIDSDNGCYDGNTNQMIYTGHVFVTDHAKARLNCERLTVDLPPDGGHPTNIVAETNVVVDLIDSKGQTNHITCNKATYAYGVYTNRFLMTVTNETITFTGGDPLPKVENPQTIMVGEPMVLDVISKRFHVYSHYQTIFKHSTNGISGGTNSSPFNLLK
jgi:lipopolysaccharide export system protein LptA